MNSVFEVAHRLEQENVDFVVITLVSGRGHIPQDPGAKAIVTSRGLHYGTVGGGKVEARAILHAQSLLEKRQQSPETTTWNLQRDIDARVHTN